MQLVSPRILDTEHPGRDQITVSSSKRRILYVLFSEIVCGCIPTAFGSWTLKNPGRDPIKGPSSKRRIFHILFSEILCGLYSNNPRILDIEHQVNHLLTVDMTEEIVNIFNACVASSNTRFSKS